MYRNKLFQTGRTTTFFLPSIEMLIKIAQFFSESTDYLLELDDRKYIEVTELSETHLAHIQQIINDIHGRTT